MTPLATVTAPDLMALELPEPVALVAGVLYPGLTVLAGKPKLGKSFLMLGLAQALAGGSEALGGLRTSRGEVLYLAIQQASTRWTMPVQDWRKALNWFAQLFGDRLLTRLGTRNLLTPPTAPCTAPARTPSAS